MNAKFKALGVAAAVAAGSFGLSSAATAQVSANGLGDLALVPYYTVKGDWQTGVHIINTTASTQVVKFRLRRDTDSADVLDINLIMSPWDEWTGYLTDESGVLTLKTSDATCTAPMSSTGTFQAPAINRDGAEEGYIEVIGMAQTTDEAQVAALGAVHASGTPVDCAAVATNFMNANFNSGASTDQQSAAAGRTGTNTWVNTADDALKVSYFIRDTQSGIEFGNDAVHVAGFMGAPHMTSQQDGLNNGNVNGFDHPNLDGASGEAGLYNTVIRAANGLGVSSIINDWSYATARGVTTDWVITIPGQYLMVDPATLNDGVAGTNWDFRDIPVTATFTVYDREEGSVVPGGLVVSPSPAPDATLLSNEVNVIEWGPAGNSVFGSDNVSRVDPSASGITAESGWASLAVVSNGSHAQIVCDYTAAATFAAASAGAAAGCSDAATTAPGTTGAVAAGSVPMMGFVAWKRSFATAERNYGRIVEHSLR